MTYRATRIATLDLLRGYFMFAVIVDHIARYPGIFDLLTGRGWLWVSAAEGFFFISGMLVGYVRGGQLRRGKSEREVGRMLIRRALWLYVLSVSLTLTFTVVAKLLGDPVSLQSDLMMNQSWRHIIAQALSLQYVYGWADFLPHYAVLMALAPLMLWLIHRQQWHLLALSSLVLWYGRGTQFELAWQLLFVGGVIGGYYLPEIELWARTLGQKTQTRLRHGLVTSTILTLLVSVMVVFGLNAVKVHPVELARAPRIVQALVQFFEWLNSTVGPSMDKWTLGPGRVLLFTLWFVTVYTLMRQHESWLVKKIGRVLLPLGRNSLLVYVFHAGLVFIYSWLWPYNLGLVANIFLSGGGVAIMWLLARGYEKRLSTSAVLSPRSSGYSQKSGVVYKA